MTSRPPDRPPPCNQQCWTWVGQGHHHAWIFTGAHNACGHQPDGHGRWTWTQRPNPNNHQPTQP